MDSRGITVVEALVGLTILSIALVFISYTITLVLNSSGIVMERTQALYLADEGHELLRHLRDENWTEISSRTNGSTYYFAVATSSIDISTTPEVIDGTFTRSVIFSEVRRNSSTDDLVTSGGSVDAGSRLVTVTVSWGTQSVSLESLLTNLHDI